MREIKHIYFVAVNFNNADFTLRFIESIAEVNTAGLNVKVVIVDNASEEEDVKKIENQIARTGSVTLIRNKENIGYFRGLNSGLAIINEKQDAIIVAGNNDLAFSDSFIKELLSVDFDNDTMIIAPDVISANGMHQNPLCIERMPWMRKWGLRIYYLNYYFGKALYNVVKFIKKATYPNRKIMKQQFIYMGIGACYILTPNFFRHFEKLPEDVFMWSEEALLAGKIKEAGGKILYCPNIIVHHAESTTVKKIASIKSYRMARESFLKTFHYY